MTLPEILNSIFGVLGIALAVTVAVGRRLGPASIGLALFLLPLSLASVVLADWPVIEAWTGEAALRLAFVLLVLSLPGAVFFASLLGSDREQTPFQKRALLPCYAVGCLVFGYLAFFQYPAHPEELSRESLLVGWSGYIAALWMLVGAIWALADLERTLRLADESVRWQIKFLVIGAAGLLGTVVYVASRVLLYPMETAVVPPGTLGVLPMILPLASLLILVGWRRSSEAPRVILSQKAVFSSITFMAVGLYLVLSSLLAQWARALLPSGVSSEAAVLLLAGLVLGVLLLSTRIRGRLRHWVRRNIFGGRYDYRLSWLEASERIRATDPPEVLAAGLTELVQRILRAGEVTVWLRQHQGETLELAAAVGLDSTALRDGAVTLAQVEALVTEGVLAETPGGPIDGLDSRFLSRTRASLVVPLRSEVDVLGLLTIGSDRSGVRFDWDAREFAQVLATHAAGEFHKGELLRAQAEAKEAEAFRAFSTFLLHDLKNFASTLSLIAKNASQHSANPEFQRDTFQSVHETSEKMKRLCNSLRVFSGTLGQSRERWDLNAIVRETVAAVDLGLKTQVRLELEDLPPLLLDRVEMERLLQNLILNANDATSGGGLIVVRTERKDDFVELSIQDDGVGFSREFLENALFVPFRTTKSQGLGIGLFQCKKIVEAHHGTIAVESEEGRGTTIRVRIPLSEGTEGADR